jgi:hypothetical protein
MSGQIDVSRVFCLQFFVLIDREGRLFSLYFNIPLAYRQVRLKATIKKLVLASFTLLSSNIFAADYALTIYKGKYSDNRLGDILLSKPADLMDSYLAVIAVSRAFPFDSKFHQWELEAQVGKHFRKQDHFEFNLLAIYRWKRFPWNRHLQTTVAIGDGLSYATIIPSLEASSTTNVGATRLLNYIMVETTFAPPQAKNWQLVVRVHHRSGVYGMFNDVEGGSNVMAAGIKFLF